MSDFLFLQSGGLTWLLIGVIIALAIYYVRILKNKYVHYEQIEQKFKHIQNFEGMSYKTKAKIDLALLVGITFFIILMLLRPTLGRDQTDAESSSLDISIVLDASVSMNVEDFDGKSRLDGSKQLVKDLIDKRPVERYSLVTFTTKGYTECPLTSDRDTIATALDTTIINSLYAEGTSVVAGLKEGITLLTSKDDALSEGRQKIILLLTDGENVNSSTDELDETLNNAVKNGIKIIAVGVGTEQGGQVPYYTNKDGSKSYIYQKGDYVISKIDEGFMKQIASKTNGTYVNANSADAVDEINSILEQNATLDKTTVNNVKYKETYFIWAFAAFILFIIYHLNLYDRVKQKVKRTL